MRKKETPKTIKTAFQTVESTSLFKKKKKMRIKMFFNAFIYVRRKDTT